MVVSGGENLHYWTVIIVIGDSPGDKTCLFGSRVDVEAEMYKAFYRFKQFH